MPDTRPPEFSQHSWRRPAGDRTVMHLLPYAPAGSETPRTAACGYEAGLWQFPTSGMTACEACIVVLSPAATQELAYVVDRYGPDAVLWSPSDPPGAPNCPVCGAPMHQEPSTSSPTAWVWACDTHGWFRRTETDPTVSEIGSDAPAGLPVMPSPDAGPYRGDDPESTDDNFDFASFSDVLPEGAIPVRGVKVIEYLDADGESAYEWRRFGTASLVEIVGLLEFTKLRLTLKADFHDDE